MKPIEFGYFVYLLGWCMQALSWCACTMRIINHEISGPHRVEQTSSSALAETPSVLLLVARVQRLNLLLPLPLRELQFERFQNLTARRAKDSDTT